jgi:formamidopyrimidine-DNA glycosylase
MPELPDLEAIKTILTSKIAGVKIERVEITKPLVIRQPELTEFESILTDNTIIAINRRGKFLLFNMKSKHILAMHFMLTGGLQYCEPRENRKPKTCFTFHLENGNHLRYFDSKMMGKIYLVGKGRLSDIPRWKEMAPDALDDEMTLEAFKQRLKRHSGQVKNILTNDTFLAGIGNAYADEILFEAKIYPFWPCTSISDEEIGNLFNAMHSVLVDAAETVENLMKDDISVKHRDFLKIHRKGGKPCPVCGTQITQVQANRRITSYCRNCQKA